MSGTIPARPKIYHITHVNNLARIIESGMIWSDAKRLEHAFECETIGMSGIKQRRMELPVTCYPDTMVGEYVPFYFCPRSVMLYILYAKNHPELTYRGGQLPIVHLEIDMHTAIAWADANGRKWAFSERNAGTYYTNFHTGTDELGTINWNAVAARDFRDSEIKDGKQAEFLLYESMPWHLVERIGVHNTTVSRQVADILSEETPSPVILVERSWYF